MSFASNDPRAQAEARKGYKMPEAKLGICTWRANPTDTESLPAVITQVGSRSVMLSVIAPDNRGLLPYDGVRHISDPELPDNPDRTNGCWDYTGEQYRLGVAEELLNGVMDELTKLSVEFHKLKTSIGA